MPFHQQLAMLSTTPHALTLCLFLWLARSLPAKLQTKFRLCIYIFRPARRTLCKCHIYCLWYFCEFAKIHTHTQALALDRTVVFCIRIRSRSNEEKRFLWKSNLIYTNPYCANEMATIYTSDYNSCIKAYSVKQRHRQQQRHTNRISTKAQNRKSHLHRTQSYADYILVKASAKGSNGAICLGFVICEQIPNHIRFKYGFKTRKFHNTKNTFRLLYVVRSGKKDDNFSSFTL